MRFTFPLVFGIAVAAMCLARPVSAGEYLVKDGVARAEIVTTEKPPRAVKLAASELQAFVKKITGATLPVVTAPTAGTPVQIYVGRSSHTDALKTTGDEVRHGGFRVSSGPNWLALVGRDRDFQPREPWPHSGADTARVLKELDKLTGQTWGLDVGFAQMWKTVSNELDIWEQDERGSLNAVYDLLRSFGCRWYLPGEIGEFVPSLKSLELPAGDRTVTPDFAYRFPYQYGRRFTHAEEVLWQLRLGLNHSPDLFGPGYLAHGINHIHSRDEVKTAHPEFYALRGDKRVTDKSGVACLSSEGLFEANVKYVRTMFDHYGWPMVSVMPSDGFTAACQCEKCNPQMTPDRGWNGQYSDYVWKYVNRVAAEVYKTHPDRKVVCLAYTTSLLPPKSIETLSPNLVVCIAKGPGHTAIPGERAAIEDLRKQWLAKMPEGHKQFCYYDYYLSARPNSSREFKPVYFPHAIAADLKSLKGSCLGGYTEVYRGAGLERFGVESLNLYFTARLYWDANQDVDAMLDEYCTHMYGPAAKPMRAFIDYCETHWSTMSNSREEIAKMFDLLASAQKAVTADSPDGKRIALVADYVQSMRQTAEQLGKERPAEGIARARSLDRSGSKVTLDGKLDEPVWNAVSTYGLRDAKTSKPLKNATTWRCFWADGALYFGVRCTEPDVKGIAHGATRDEDTGIWSGDCIEFLLETQTHSYYQLAVGANGKLVDLDRQGKKLKSEWSSGAQAAAFVGDNFWSMELRVPVAGGQQADVDPLQGIDGRRPTDAFPWFVNVCRQRVRDGVRETMAWSPTGKDGFHEVQKFGVLVGPGRTDKWKPKDPKDQ